MRRFAPILIVAALLFAGPAAMASESRSYRGTTDQGKPISLSIREVHGAWYVSGINVRARCEWPDGSHQRLKEANRWPRASGPEVTSQFFAEVDTGFTYTQVVGRAGQVHARGGLEMAYRTLGSPPTDTCQADASWRASAR